MLIFQPSDLRRNKLNARRGNKPQVPDIKFPRGWQGLVEPKLSGPEIASNVIVVVPEVHVALHKVVHKLHHGQVLGDAEGGVVLVEVKLRDGSAFGVAVGHHDFGLGMQVPHGQFIDVAVGVKDAGLAIGLLQEGVKGGQAFLPSIKLSI